MMHFLFYAGSRRFRMGQSEPYNAQHPLTFSDLKVLSFSDISSYFTACEKFKRPIFIPSSAKLCMVSRDSDAGPIVQTILVLASEWHERGGDAEKVRNSINQCGP